MALFGLLLGRVREHRPRGLWWLRRRGYAPGDAASAGPILLAAAPQATSATAGPHATIHGLEHHDPPLTADPEPAAVANQPNATAASAYTFDQPDAPGRLRTQYFEIMGRRLAVL